MKFSGESSNRDFQEWWTPKYGITILLHIYVHFNLN